MSIHKIPIQNILFLDIETVPEVENFNELDAEMKKLWDSKSRRFQDDNSNAEAVYEKAGIFAEFGKIICISAAYIHLKKKHPSLRVTSFTHTNEKELLQAFVSLVSKHFGADKDFLCAHNGKEFDFPFIARRTLLHGIKLPKTLDTRGLKPWEVRHLDTLDLWRFGDYKNYTSLNLLTKIFGIPSPKQDIDGSQIYEVYYKEQNLDRIKEYCQLDAIAVAQLYLKYLGKEIIPPEAITIVKDTTELTLENNS